MHSNDRQTTQQASIITFTNDQQQQRAQESISRRRADFFILPHTTVQTMAQQEATARSFVQQQLATRCVAAL